MLNYGCKKHSEHITVQINPSVTVPNNTAFISDHHSYIRLMHTTLASFRMYIHVTCPPKWSLTAQGFITFRPKRIKAAELKISFKINSKSFESAF